MLTPLLVECSCVQFTWINVKAFLVLSVTLRNRIEQRIEIIGDGSESSLISTLVGVL